MLQLTIRSPENEAGQSCSISGSSVTIGRNRLNDLCLADGTVSDFHAEIVPDGHGGWKVNDHDSSNGTFLNNARVKSKPIRSGDLIAFGGVETIVEAAAVELGDDAADDDLESAFATGVPHGEASPAHFHESEAVDTPPASLPSAQIEQAMAMHRARMNGGSGKVDTIEPAPRESAPAANAEGAPISSTGEVAEMHDRLKHALGELQALKDKHAIQTRELERYQERADLLADPDADITKLRIQVSDLKRKSEEAERKLYEKDKEVVELRKLAEVDNAGASTAASTDEFSISLDEHDAAINLAVKKANAASEEQMADLSARIRKQHRAEIEDLKKRHDEQAKNASSDRSEVAALENFVEELSSDLENQRAEKKGRNAELKARDFKLAEKAVEVEQLEKRVVDLQGTIESLQGDDATRSDEVAKLSAERDQRAELFEKREAELAELSASHDAATDRLAEVEAERDQLDTAKSEALEELRDAVATIQKQEQAAANFEKRIAELESQAEQGDEEILAENQRLSGELESSAAKVAALTAELGEAATRNAELEESIAGQEAELASKVADLAVLRAELSEKEASISSAVETEAELRMANEAHEATIKELRAEVEVLSGKSGNAAAQLSDSLVTIQNLNDELAALKSEHGEADAARGAVKDLEAEAEKLRGAKQKLEKEREQMQSALNEERIKLDRERVAIDAERVTLQATLKESERQAEAAGEKLKNVEQEVAAKRLELEDDLEDLQSEVIIERQRLEELTGKAETAEERARKASNLVEETAERWDRAEVEARKEERRLAGLRRKLKRRRKLIEQLKGIGRREQELKRKIAEAQQILLAAEEHKPGRAAPAVPRPWDVDKAVIEHEAMLQKTRELEESLAAKKAEWEKIDQEVQAGRGPSGEEVEEIDGEKFAAAVARAEELESMVDRLEIEKRSLIDTVSALKVKIAAAGAGASGSVVP